MSDLTKDTVQRQFARQLVSKLFARAGYPNALSFDPKTLLDTLDVALGQFLNMVDEMRRMDMVINTGAIVDRGMHTASCAKVIGFDSSKECDCCKPPAELAPKQSEFIKRSDAVRYSYLQQIATRPEVLRLLELNPSEWDEYIDQKIADYVRGA
jgi:hypothetical protein